MTAAPGSGPLRPGPDSNPEERPEAFLRTLVRQFVESGEQSLVLEIDGFQVALGRAAPFRAVVANRMPATASPAPAAAAPSLTVVPAEPSAGALPIAPGPGLIASHLVRSPAVGLFRPATLASGGVVSPGSHVGAEDLVAVITVMRRDVPVIAETAGVVEELYVGEGDFVEYGQPLARIARE